MLTKAAFALILVPVLVPVWVIRTNEARLSGAFTVTHTSTNICNLVTIKNLVKTVKYLEFLAKVYSITCNDLRSSLRQIMSHLYHMLNK